MPAGYPKIDSASRIIEANVGQKAIIECKATGSQTLEISWFKFGALVSLDKDGARLSPEGSLVLSNVDRADAGLYKCMALNGVGAVLAETATELIVNQGNCCYLCVDVWRSVS